MTDLLAGIIDCVGFLCGTAVFAVLSLLPIKEKIDEHKKGAAVIIGACAAVGAAVFSALSGTIKNELPCILFAVFALIVFALAKMRIFHIDFKKTYWVECIALAGASFFQAGSIGLSHLIFGAGKHGRFGLEYFIVSVPVAVAIMAALIMLIKKVNFVTSQYRSVTSSAVLALHSAALAAISVGGAIIILTDITAAKCANFLVAFTAATVVFTMWCGVSEKAKLAERVGIRNMQLERIIDIQKQQIHDINEQIAKTKTACHDLRHHMSAIRRLITEREYEKLCEYLTVYGRSLPDGPEESVCGNAAVDSVVRYFSALAASKGVSTNFDLQSIDDNCGIATPDLCIVFGNALENAVEAAASACESRRFDRARCKNDDGWLTLVIGNGFSVAPKMVNGAFLSSKKDGRVGIGTESIREIAEKYNGSASFEIKDNLFRTSVILFK